MIEQSDLLIQTLEIYIKLNDQVKAEILVFVNEIWMTLKSKGKNN